MLLRTLFSAIIILLSTGAVISVGTASQPQTTMTLTNIGTLSTTSTAYIPIETQSVTTAKTSSIQYIYAPPMIWGDDTFMVPGESGGHCYYEDFEFHGLEGMRVSGQVTATGSPVNIYIIPANRTMGGVGFSGTCAFFA